METGHDRRGRRALAGLLLAGLLVSATGCINTKQTVWLNPDGSGRMALETVVPLAGSLINISGRDDERDPEQQARDQVAGYLRRATGVDAWSDLAWELTDDFKLDFRATLLFPDLAAIDIPNLFLVPVAFREEGPGRRLVIEPPGADQEADTAAPEELSAAEIERRARQARAKFSQAWPGMSGFFAQVRQEAVFYLPGPIGDHRNLAVSEGNRGRFILDGARFVAVMDELAGDDQWWQEQVRVGRDVAGDGPLGDDTLMEKLFGEKGAIEAVVAGPLEPLFDYAAAVDGAREETAEIFAAFGLDAPAAPAPAAGEAVSPPATTGAVPPDPGEEPGDDPGEGWSIERPRGRIPEVPLAGSIFGRPFELGEAIVGDHSLEIRSRETINRWPAGQVIIFGVNRESVTAGQSWTVTPDDEGHSPHVHMRFARGEAGRMPGTLMFTGQYSMRLVVEDVSGDSARLRLHLSLPDYRKSYLLGVFQARLR